MKELGKWQIISFISRGLAMVAGLVQSFVIVRILSVSDWGIVQLAVSVGGALGIYQHLGLASASTREISGAKDDDEVFKIFFTSVFIRYLVTLPIVLGLFFFAEHIAVNVYHSPDLIIPLKIYAGALLFQGVQSILNSVISGTKRFKNLFLYQVGISVMSVVLYVPLVYFFKVNGFFYAFILFNIINSLGLTIVAFKPLKATKISLTKNDFKRLFKEIFSISMAIYFVKILYTNWEKMGGNVLGLFNSPETVAIYSFALLYGKKLMSISDSVTDVSLPVLSEKFKNNLEEFRATFSRNFDKIFVFVILSATVASYWAPEIIRVLVGSDKYEASYVLVPAVILSFIIYSFINIVKSSVLIPAKMTKTMIFTFLFLILGTGGFFLLTYKELGLLGAMSWGMAFGSILAFILMNILIRKVLGFAYFKSAHTAILIQSLSIIMLGSSDNTLYRQIFFIPLLLMLMWSFMISKFLTISEVKELAISLKRKFSSVLSSLRENKKLFKYLQLGLKLFVSAGLLAYIYLTLDKEAFVQNIKLLNWKYIPIIFLLLIANYVVSSIRWKSLLIYKGTENVSVGFLTKLYFIGSFFNNFMPTSIGGDVYKIYALNKKIKDGAKAFSSTFMERFTGIVVLAFISAFGLIDLIGYWSIGLFISMIVGFFIGLKMLKILSKKIKKLSKLYESLIAYKGHTKTIVWAIITSLVVQLISIFTQYFIFKSIGITLPIWYSLFVFPVITISGFFIPSLNGIGVQDALYIQLFASVGVGAEVAASASILYHLARLGVSLIGGVLYATSKNE